jgi:hypothetical protein
MRVTSISVSVRYSKQMGDGSYKTVELGCEGAWRRMRIGGKPRLTFTTS